MICKHCNIPGFVATVSGLCQSCERAERDATTRRAMDEPRRYADVLHLDGGQGATYGRWVCLEGFDALRAEVERLRSERDAVVEALKAERDLLSAKIDKVQAAANADYQWVVDREARERLSAIRNLQGRAAEAEVAADALRAEVERLKAEVEMLRESIVRLMHHRPNYPTAAYRQDEKFARAVLGEEVE